MIRIDLSVSTAKATCLLKVVSATRTVPMAPERTRVRLSEVSKNMLNKLQVGASIKALLQVNFDVRRTFAKKKKTVQEKLPT